MTQEYCNKVFRIIYDNVSKKHPAWSQARIFMATRWCYKKSMKPKTIKRCKYGQN